MLLRKKGLRALGIFMLTAALVLNGGQSVVNVCATEASQTQSDDGYLKTFNVSPGTMSPAFTPSVTSYTVTVGSDVDKLNVTCSTMNANATVVEAKGFKNLQMGSNSAVITVQSPSGNKVSYRITIIRGNISAASNPVEGAGITLATNNTTSTAPAQTSPSTPVAPVATEPAATAQDTTDMGTDSTALDTADEDTMAEMPEATDVVAEPQTVETMAMPGERYLIGGESIYSDYYAVSTLDTSLLPDGFVVEPYNLNGATVQSAYMAAGNIRLLFTESEEGTNAGWRIYYEDDKNVLDFVPFLGYSGYVFPVRYQAQIPVPQNYTGSYMPFDKKVVSCYIYTELTDNPLSVQAGMESKDTLQPGESTADADPVAVDELAEMPEFYLFYGMNSKGEEGFYLYDMVEGTYQRYVERDTSYDLDQSYFKYKDMSHHRFIYMCICIILLLIAIFVIINLIVKNRELQQSARRSRRQRPIYDDEDDDDEEEEESLEDDEDEEPEEDFEEEEDESEESEEDYFEPEEKRGFSFKNLFKAKKDDDEDDYDDEDEDEDEEDDDENFRSSGESDGDSGLTFMKRTTPVDHTRPTSFNPGFKMLNLSREPEPSGIDDDFEFEFINYEDD